MKWCAKILICALCGLALARALRAAPNDSPGDPAGAAGDGNGNEPYRSIWLRNVFDLKPPSPVVTEAPKTNSAPPNVHLTGITTVPGNKRALFLVQDPPERGKPVRPDKSVILGEGERRDALEVLEINPAARSVKIKLADVVSTMTFETSRTSSLAARTAGGLAQQPGFGQTPGGFDPNGSRGNPGGLLPNRPAFGQAQAGGGAGFSPPSTPGYPPPVYSGGFAPGSFAAANSAPGGPNNASPSPNAFSQPPASPPGQSPEISAAILAAQESARIPAGGPSDGSSLPPQFASLPPDSAPPSLDLQVWQR